MAQSAGDWRLFRYYLYWGTHSHLNCLLVCAVVAAQVPLSMAKVSDFLEAPSGSGLADFTKDQLLEITKHYEISISRSAAHLKYSLVATLFDG